MSGKQLKTLIRLNQKANQQYIDSVLKASADTKRRNNSKPLNK